MEERGGSSSEPDESDELQEVVMESLTVVTTKQEKYEMKMKEVAEGGRSTIGKKSEKELLLVDVIPDSVMKNPLFVGVKVLSGTSPVISMEFVASASERKLLIASIAEEAARKSLVRSYNGIRNAFVLDRKGEDGQNGLALQTEGCSFITL